MTTRRAVPEYWNSRINKNIYNLNTFALPRLEVTGVFDMPVLQRSDLIPDNIFPWDERNKWKPGAGPVHFYCFDNEFESVWLRAGVAPYVPAVVRKAGACLSPDFSLFTDFPKPLQIWNVYRSRLLSALWASEGIEVVPSVTWGDPGSFDWCFDGLPDGGTLAIATGHINKDEREFFLAGFDQMVERCSPDTVLVYGRGLKGILEERANVKRYDSRLTQIYEQRKAQQKEAG